MDDNFWTQFPGMRGRAENCGILDPDIPLWNGWCGTGQEGSMGSAQKFECWKSSQADSDNCERVAEGVLEESFTKENMLKNKSTKRVSPSHLRRKERRAADPAVRQRAAQHQAREAATAPPMEEALRTPEKERRSSATSSLQVSPVKDDTREEAGDEQVVKE